MIPYYKITSFDLGPITIQTWGFFVALGIIASLAYGLYLAKQYKISSDNALAFTIAIVIGSMIGARIFYVMLFWDDFSESLIDIFSFWTGGMVLYGGVIGGFIAGSAYVIAKKLPYKTFADIVSICLPLGFAVGRIGCHLIKDHVGVLTSVPWGVMISESEIRHDTAIYSILNGLVMFVVLALLRKKIKTPGQIAIIAVLWYSVARFFIDNYRATDILGADPRFYGLTVSQYISIILAILTSFWLLYTYINNQAKKKSA
ncbi:prolipoprotein diacylglyceryl transferase [Patescibacteria group bacterium]